jgi:hypothetical protein
MIITTSASSLSRFQACELAWKFAKKEGLSPVERPVYLDRGTLIHALLEEHYKGVQNQEPRGELIKRVSGMSSFLAVNKTQLAVGDPKIIEECAEVYRKYALFYSNENWTIIAVEKPFSYCAYDDGEDKVLVEGRIDLVPQISTGEILIVDHKSVTKQGFYTPLTPQFRIYSMISGVSTVTINEVGFQKTPVFRRTSVSYLPGQIEEFKEKILKEWCKRLLDTIKKDIFLANPSSCKFCDFKPICEATESARSWKKEQLFKVSEGYDVFSESE